MSRRTFPSLRRASRGFTLVELMIALLLGLFLLIALVSLLVSNVTTRSELDKIGRQIENGRYALQLISEDLQNSGYLGSAATTAFSIGIPIPCAAQVADLGFVPQTNPGTSSIPLPVYGLSAVPTTCVTNKLPYQAPDTAALLVTRVSTTAITTATMTAGETYLQVSNCATDKTPFAVGTSLAVIGGNNTPGAFDLMRKDCTTPEVLRKVIQRIYFVSSCDVCTGPGADNPPIPTLKMAEYVGGAMTFTPLVEGIENLQFDYGVDRDGDGAPDCYVSNPGSPPPSATSPSPTEVAACSLAPAYDWSVPATNWANVMAIRIHVLARATEASAGWSDGRKFEMGMALNTDGLAPFIGTVGPFPDAFKRHVYSAVARMYNASGQREQP